MSKVARSQNAAANNSKAATSRRTPKGGKTVRLFSSRDSDTIQKGENSQNLGGEQRNPPIGGVSGRRNTGLLRRSRKLENGRSGPDEKKTQCKLGSDVSRCGGSCVCKRELD